VVASLCYAGKTPSEISLTLGRSWNSVRRDLFNLAQRGLVPIDPSSGDRTEAIRRNHVVRISKYPNVQSVRDYRRYCDYPETLVESDLRWLFSQGIVPLPHYLSSSPDDASPAPASPVPSDASASRAKTSDEPPRPPTSDLRGSSTFTPDLPKAKVPALPKAKAPSKKMLKIGTTSELEDSARRQLEKAPVATFYTSSERGHSHSSTVDADGNGRTDATGGTSHRIDKFYVASIDKHSHQLLVEKS